MHIADTVFWMAEHVVGDLPRFAAAEVKPLGLAATLLLGRDVPGGVVALLRITANVEGQLLCVHQGGQRHGQCLVNNVLMT